MRKLFYLDSPLLQAVSRAVDLVILNVLTLLCCLPVVTAGAAVTALYDTAGRIIREEGRLWKCYWKAFGSNFIQSTVLGLILLLSGGLLGFGLWFYLQIKLSSGQEGLFWLCTVLLLIWAMAAVWVFPLQSRFQNTVTATLRNAMLCAVIYPLRTLAALVIQLVPAALVLFATQEFLQTGPIWLLIWFSLAAYLTLLLLRKPFSKLENRSEQT